MSTIDTLREIFRDVFDDENIEICPEMSNLDYEEWDSLTHIQLIVAVERKFNIKFSTDEVLKLKNASDFVTFIDSKLI